MEHDLTPAYGDTKTSMTIQWKIALVCLFLVIALLAWNTFAPQRWEYKIETVSDLGFTTEINAIGNDGWEVVFARRASTGPLDSPSGAKPEFAYEMIFKRRATLWR